MATGTSLDSNALIFRVTQCNKNLLNTIEDVDFFNTRVGTLIVATIYLQLIQNRYMFLSFTVLQCSHQHCVQPVASDVEVVGYL